MHITANLVYEIYFLSEYDTVQRKEERKVKGVEVGVREGGIEENIHVIFRKVLAEHFRTM